MGTGSGWGCDCPSSGQATRRSSPGKGPCRGGGQCPPSTAQPSSASWPGGPGQTAGQRPPHRGSCPAPRDGKGARRGHRGGSESEVRWPESQGCTRPGHLQGSRPCVPTPWLMPPESGPGSLGRGAPATPAAGKRSLAPQTPAVPGSRNAQHPGWCPELAPRAPCCPAARANKGSTHRPQNLCDKFRASKCVIGKSPLGPSQEPWGWGGHVSRETRCKGPPSATVGAPS